MNFLDTNANFLDTPVNFLDAPVNFLDTSQEHFLVPDHRIVSILGASFAGFYYCVYERPDTTTSYTHL